MSLSPGGRMSDHFIPSSSDPNWDPEETLAQYYNRCVTELGNGSFSLSQEETPESACDMIMAYKKYGMHAPGYTDTRQLLVIGAYSLLIVVGVITNLSVCWVVVRNSQARTARNLFVINLAVSDLSVCLVTMPLTMLRLIHLPSWNYGASLCKMIGVLEGANLLVSSGTASAIAGDRLCLVTRKTARRNDTKVSTIVLILLLIWSLSFLSFIPTFFFNGTYNFYLPDTGLVLYHVCAEFWPSHAARFAFTAFLMFVQYVIPISVILVTHAKIINIVKARVNNVKSGNSTSSVAAAAAGLPLLAAAATSVSSSTTTTQVQPTMRRNKKTTQILLIIAFCFGVSWLPYHGFMIMLEVNKMLDFSLFELSTETETDLFTLVHLLAMSSTVSNPILYGWLNTNLKHLFRAMIPYVRQQQQQQQQQQELNNSQQRVLSNRLAAAGLNVVAEEDEEQLQQQHEMLLNRQEEEQETLVDNVSSRRSSPESLRTLEMEKKKDVVMLELIPNTNGWLKSPESD